MLIIQIPFFFLTLYPKQTPLKSRSYFQAKQSEELEKLRDAVTDMMEAAASTTDLSTARQGLLHSMERLMESLAAEAPLENCPDTGMTDNMKYIRPWTHGGRLR